MGVAARGIPWANGIGRVGGGVVARPNAVSGCARNMRQPACIWAMRSTTAKFSGVTATEPASKKRDVARDARQARGDERWAAARPAQRQHQRAQRQRRRAPSSAPAAPAPAPSPAGRSLRQPTRHARTRRPARPASAARRPKPAENQHQDRKVDAKACGGDAIRALMRQSSVAGLARRRCRRRQPNHRR